MWTVDNLFPFVPTCNDAMSSLTYITFCALIVGINIGTGALVWWIRREITRVDKRIDMHDTFVDDTTATLSTMSTDIAVTRETVQNIDAAMSDTKKSISDINRTLIDKLPGR